MEASKETADLPDPDINAAEIEEDAAAKRWRDSLVRDAATKHSTG
jgi:hypothetical protein